MSNFILVGIILELSSSKFRSISIISPSDKVSHPVHTFLFKYIFFPLLSFKNSLEEILNSALSISLILKYLPFTTSNFYKLYDRMKNIDASMLELADRHV